MQMSHNIQLTGVLIEDEKKQGFTAFLAEMPDVIAEGRTQEEALQSLFETFNFVMQFKRDELAERMDFESRTYMNTHHSRSIPLQFSSAFAG